MILVILSICLLPAAAARPTQDPQIKRNVLNKILFGFNNTASHHSYQHVTCGTSGVDLLGIYPAMGSEMGGTPVAVALQTSFNGETSNEPDAIQFDSSTLSCKFGETTQPMLHDSEVDAQLERMALTVNDSTDSLSGDNVELLVCVAPRFPESGAVPGPLPFSVTCKDEEEETIQESTLDFDFTIASLVYEANPPLGRAGTEITVKGSGFRNSSSLMCFYGQRKAKANFVSSDTVLCPAPDLGDGEYSLSVSNNGIDAEGEWDGVIFAYVPLPIVNTVQPQTVTRSANTTVYITGHHFTPHPSAIPMCSFGKNATSLTIVESDDVLSCPIPTIHDAIGQNPYIVNVRVSTNGGNDFSTSSSRAFLYQDVVLHSALPEAAHMGSTIAINGRNFHPSNVLSCWFQSNEDDDYISMPATYISSSKIECQIPNDEKSHPRLTLWVSTNNEVSGRSLNSLNLRVLDFMSVISIAPSIGSPLGGTSILVRGTGFDKLDGNEDSPTKFRFGNAAVTAKVLNSTCLTFVTPPAVAALGGNSFEMWTETHLEDTVVSLEISTNSDHDYTDTGITFRYLDQPSIESMSSNLGPQTGGTLITFRGKGIGNVAATEVGGLACDFMLVGLDYKVPLSPISITDEDSLSCRSPPMSIIVTTLESSRTMAARIRIISRNSGEVAIATGDAMFTFYPKVTLANLHPPGGSNLGGTRVEIRGSNFAQTGLVKCLFDGIESSVVKWISPSRIVCEAPEAASRSLESSIVNVTLVTNEGEMLTADYLQFVYLPASHILNFNPAFGSMDGGTSIHIQGSGFDQIEGLPPQCLFSTSKEPAIATVLSRSLIKCIIPPSGLENTTTVALSFNGGSDVVSSDKLFSYISPATINTITPKYISSDGGAKVTIRGNNFLIPGGELRETLRCSFGDRVVAATAITTETMVCFAPQSEPGLVEVRVSTNGVDFTTHALEVVYHLPSQIHEIVPPFAAETGGTTMVKGSNFQPSPDLSCIFSFSPENTHIADATFETQDRVKCSVPPSHVGAVSATLEISNEKEKNSKNPSKSFQYYALLSISSIRPHGNEVILEADGLPSLEEQLFCCFTPLDERETKPLDSSKAQAISSTEVRCTTPYVANHYDATNFSIALGIVFDGICHDLTDPQAEPFLSSRMNEVETTETPIGLNSNVHVFGKVVTIEPTVVSEVGGSIISVVSSDLELSGDASCLFSATTELRVLPNKSPASIVTNHRKYKGRQEFHSHLLTCHAPRMTPGEYLLSLESADPLNEEGLLLSEIAVITVHPAFSIIGFEPSSGPSDGGTALTIHGSNFPNTIDLSCKIGSSVTQTRFVSQEKIICISPPARFSPEEVVSVSANGQDFVDVEVGTFSYTNRPLLSEVFPVAGAAAGGTLLTILGKYLLPKNAEIIVTFDNVEVKGFSLNETAITCITPPLETEGVYSSVSILVSTNGGYDFSKSGMTFSYHNIFISQIEPSYGPEKGGNTVTIDGSGFVASQYAACRFGDVETRARVTSGSSMECVAPDSVAHLSVSVAITVDGTDWVISPLSYSYLPMLRIFEMTPTALPTNVPYTIHIEGDNFGYWVELWCKLGSSKPMKAIVIGDNSLECLIPPIHQLGELTFDIVAKSGISLLENRSTIKFHNAIDFHISPSFGNMDGGTIIMVALGSALSIGFDLSRNQAQLMCRFSLGNDSPTIIDVMASSLNRTLLSCVTPDVTAVLGPTDDIVHSTMSLVSTELILPASLSFPFMFKRLPVVSSISPSIGSGAGGTIVRVTGYGPGFWLNSSLLTCYFGEETGGAKWISPLVVDCSSPASQNISEVPLFISDNGSDRSESGSTFLFHPDPLVNTVGPRFGLTSIDNNVTFFGTGFSGRDAPVCIFIEQNGEKHVYVDGRIVNETAMECHIPSEKLGPSEYVCKASNNGGIEWGPAGAHFVLVRPPSITSLTPQSGIEAESVPIVVSGAHLITEGWQHTYCVLLDHAGSQMGSSLARKVNDTSVNCLVQCPSHDHDTKYFLGLSLNHHPSSVHTFWCYPKPMVIAMMPSLIGVGESTSVRIHVSDLRYANSVHCIFSGNGQTATMPGRYGTGVVDCLTPVFDRPQRAALSVSINSHTLSDELQLEVVQELVYDVSPRAIFAGSDVRIKGSNLVPENLNCRIGGMDGTIIWTEKPDVVVCRSAATTEKSPTAEVSLSFKDAPQLSVTVGNIEIRPTPDIHTMTPLSGLTHGGTIIMIRGLNFLAIESPSCHFGDVAVSALVLTEKSISCTAPKNKSGQVKLRVSLDGGYSYHGEQFFSYFAPIILQKVYPRVAVNGTKLHLRGEGFRSDLQCAMGAGFVPAIVLSSTEATCIFAPAMEDLGLASLNSYLHHPLVEIYLVTSDHVPASVGFGPQTSVVYHPLVEISSSLTIDALEGVDGSRKQQTFCGSVLGGDFIEIQTRFIKEDIGPIYCRFGSKVALAAVMLNKSTVSCKSPAANAPGNVTLSLIYEGLPFSSNSLLFEYTLEPKVYGITPRHGTILGGTSVRINGLNIRSIVSCRFGHHESYGYLDTDEDSAVYCITPRLNYVSSQTLKLMLDSAKNWIDTGFDFHFYEPISIESVSPREIDHGVEFVRVKGKGFSRGTDLRCCLGEGDKRTMTEAIILSNTTIECPTPWEAVNDFGAQIPLSITSNGVDFVGSNFPLTHTNRDGVPIRSLSSTLGPAFGGTEVDVFLSISQEMTNLRCWFGSVSVRAIFVSDDHITCITPPSSAKESQRGVVLSNVSVTHGHSFAIHATENSVPFAFYSHPFRLIISPTHGLSEGGTKVRIIGALANILRRLNVLGLQGKPSCQFDALTVPAKVEFDELVCISPPFETRNNSTRAVAVAVSLNGQDFVPTQQSFHYYHAPTVNSVTPEVFWIDNATDLVIRGSHFIALNEASCFVADMKVPAEVVSSSEIRCHVQLNLTYSNDLVPVGVSMNGYDLSNIIPVLCRANMPRITSASPLFVSDSGDTVVELKGYGLKQTEEGGLVELRDSNAVANLFVIDDETASFRVPSSNGHNSASVWIGIGSDTFVDTGFELQYLPHLRIESVDPPYIFLGKESRVEVSGKFDENHSYSCVLFGDNNNETLPFLETTADFSNGTVLVCDVAMYHTATLSLAVRREEDSQTSNAVKLFPTPDYAIASVDPAILSDVEAGTGGQLVVLGLKEENVNRSIGDAIDCRFVDEIGTVTVMKAYVVAANEVRCVAPRLTGNTEVRLARGGIPQSNALMLKVHPSSQILRMSPASGPASQGTQIKVHGVGFAAYSGADVLCTFGTESSFAQIIDDETICCLTPSNIIDGNVTFVLVQASAHGLTNISNSDMNFFFYAPPKLIDCTPNNGPASGGTEISVIGEGLSDIGSSIKLSFSSINDPDGVAYSKEVKVLSTSSIVLLTPPSPMSSKGGIVTIKVSGNGQDYSSPGIYYNYTESIFIDSVNPRQVTESSCFNLTLYVENLFSLPSHCSVGGHNYPAKEGMILGKVICEMCLDVHEGFQQVGLVTDNGVFVQANVELEVRPQIHITKMTPPMGPTDGGTVVLVKGTDFEAWDIQLYCFFGDIGSPAKVFNDTALQCVAPASQEEKVLSIHVAPYYQRKSDNDSILFFEYYKSEEVDSFVPRSGPVGGGTVVQISGSGFIDTKYLGCKFGDATTRAVFVSEEKIECTSSSLADAMAIPVALPKSTPLMVSNNAKDFLPSGTFIYHGTPQITRLSPSSGPARTNVKLAMQTSLEWAEKLACRFGDVLAPSRATSDREIECTSPIPKDNETPNVTVQISLNGLDFFGDGLTFQYSNRPLVYSVIPDHGPMSGQNQVVVHGNNFLADTVNVLCRFGLIETVATSISATKITCVAPPQNHGAVSLSIILREPNIVVENHHDNKLIEYVYLTPIVISTISPAFGSMNGGTLLSINVEEHHHLPLIDNNLFCVFGSNATSTAQIFFTNSTMVNCLTPPSNTNGDVSVGLAQDQHNTLLTAADASFHYTAEPKIKSMFPRRGPTSGGTIITLQGNFEHTDKKSAHCKIGNQTTPVSFISNEEVKCITAPGDHNVVREIQAIRIVGDDGYPLVGVFTLEFKGGVTDSISTIASADAMKEKLSTLPGMEDISVELLWANANSVQKSFLITFHGLVHENQPLINVHDMGILGDDAAVFVERVQPICCDISLSLNGVDYNGADNGDPLLFVFDEKLLVSHINPSFGSMNGGTVVNLTVTGGPSTHVVEHRNASLMCIFGSDEVEGRWVDEGIVSCTSPASLSEARVAVGTRIGFVRSESLATFLFHPDPVITSIFPESLPAFDMTTSSIDVHGNHFYNSSLTCVFDVSLPSNENAFLQRRHDVNRQPAIFHNSTFIRCPQPPSLQLFFSPTDSSWATNATLLADAVLNLSLETGADWHFIGTIPYHAVVKANSIFPRSGPRAGGTNVMVEGENFVNSTYLTCKFGSFLGPSAQYVSPKKVLCKSPYFPFGYGRMAVPVQVAANAVDFSVATNVALFEFHEPIVIREAAPLVGMPKGGTIVNITLDDSTMHLRAVSSQDNNSVVAISHIDPPYGPASGGNIVAIHGNGFTPNHYTCCKFGETIIPAYFVTEQAIECSAPKSDAISTVNVTLTINVAEVPSYQSYTYLPIIVIT